MKLLNISGFNITIWLHAGNVSMTALAATTVSWRDDAGDNETIYTIQALFQGGVPRPKLRKKLILTLS